MYKLVVLAAVMAVAFARPGGHTGLVLDHGLGHIHAPNVVSHGHPQHVAVIAQPISHAPVHAAVSLHAPVIAHAEPLHVVPHHQPLAPLVHTAPIVTRTVLPTHDHYTPVHSHGLH